VVRIVDPTQDQWDTFNLKCMHTRAIYVVPRVANSTKVQLAQYKFKSPYTYIINDVPRVVHRRKVQHITSNACTHMV
jgi:hypothetical protein